MANTKQTSKRIAKIAAKGLRKPGSVSKPKQKSVHASALAQTKSSKKPKKAR